MLHTKFLKIGQPVPEKKIFEGFLSSHLGHVVINTNNLTNLPSPPTE